MSPQIIRYTYRAGWSLLWVGLEKTLDKVLCVVTDFGPIPWVEDDLFVTALFDEIAHGLAAEGRITTEKRVGNDTEGPHVYRLAMAFLFHDFWRSIAK